jgi:nicotinate-nucleotide adenylyltransferase
VAVAERAGAPARGGALSAGDDGGLRERISYIDVPRLDISSSALRRRVREGRPLDYLVADPVADYIEQRRLYL